MKYIIPFISLFIFGISSVAYAQQEGNLAKRILILGDYNAYQLSETFKNSASANGTVEFIGSSTILDGFKANNWNERLQYAFDGKEKPFVVIVFLSHTGEQSGGVVELTGTRTITRAEWEQVTFPLLDSLKKSKIQYIWVSAPPVANQSLLKTIEDINTFIRERISENGVFVDLWSDFADEEGLILINGVNVEGKVTALRDKKGVHFTDSGIKKVSYYIEREIQKIIFDQEKRRLALLSNNSSSYDYKNLSSAAIDPTSARGGVKIGTSLFRPLIRDERRFETEILISPPVISESAAPVLNALHNGVPLPYKKGRADDFSWNGL